MVEFVPDVTMNMTTQTDIPAKTDSRLSHSLNQVLADSYALMALTHLAHWNVEGPGFFAIKRQSGC